MNDPQFLEASRHIAKRIMKDGGKTPLERVEYAYRLVTSRKPKSIVAQILVAAFNEELVNYKKDAEAAGKLLAVGTTKRDESLNASEHAAWTIVASMILNLDEVITRL